MDDHKICEMERLKLAYKKQLVFMASLIATTLIGLAVYVFNIYNYNQALFIAAVVIIITGVIGVMTVDQKMRLISSRFRKM